MIQPFQELFGSTIDQNVGDIMTWMGRSSNP